jgi:glycosyltransferase involved in cell wall biosynthesis
MGGRGLQNRIVFDLTDLIVYYGSSVTPTGIQRVVGRLVGSGTLQQAPDTFFAFRAKNANTFWSLDKSLFVGLQHSKTRCSAISNLQVLDQYRRDRLRLIKAQTRPWKFLQRKYRDASRRVHQTERMGWCAPFQFRAGDILVMPGAFWIEPDVSEFYAQLREQYQLQLVLFIHDLIPINHAWCVPHSEKFEREFRTLISSCDRVVAVSKHVAAEVTEYLTSMGSRGKSIFTLAFGWDFPEHAKNQVSELATLSKYRLRPRNFIMNVGTIERRKNQVLVGRAAYNLCPRLKDKLPPIVFVGKLGPGAELIEQEFASVGFVGERIRILSETSDDELANLYAACQFTVFASFAEGWGLPVQESLAFGRPCLASRATSIPEAGLDLATYFDPHDPVGFQELLASWLEQPSRVSEAEGRIARYMAVHKPLTWEQSAAALIDRIRAGCNPAGDHRPGAEA